uniref:Egal-1 winged helix domain-containing protein n=1 Tax=Trichobilharzia regenti TaxID=157069 RepID=A0AA85K1G1_TRIRE|nr:unnamed protein product [Trichobilharzia regenti]
MSEAYILAALEFLIQFGGNQNVSDLWAHMCNKFHQVSDFKYGIGKSIHTFERFLSSNPLVFNVVNNVVCLTDISNPMSEEKPSSNQFINRGNNYSKSVRNNRSKYTIESEASAVRYFQEHLLRKPERWVPIKNLAGHLSQASPHIRISVGPQSEFVEFLMRHPLIFDIQGDLVGLRDKFKTICSAGPPPSHRRKIQRPLSSHIPEDIYRTVPYHCVSNGSLIPPPTSHEDLSAKSQNNDNIVVCLDDCKAIFWLMYVIKHSFKDEVVISRLLAELARAPNSVRNCIGWTQIELLEFLRKYSRIFSVDETTGVIELHYTNKLNLFIASRHVNDSSCGLIISQKGCIFCVNRLWGIIDLGFHEHVFFDRSLFKNVMDLTKHFKVKEIVYFNAVLAPKDSRAKWRATCVWKETDQIINQLSKINHSDNGIVQPSFPPGSSSEQQQQQQHNRQLQSNDDPDSGLDNSDELIDHKKKLNNSTKRDCSIKALFDEDDLSSEYDLIINQFANVRMVDVWEIEQFTSQEKHTNSQISPNAVVTGDSITNNHNDRHQQATPPPPQQQQHTRTGHPMASPHNPSDLDRSSSVSSESLSDLNTLSEIPSIMSGIQLEPPMVTRPLSYVESTISNNDTNCDSNSKILMHKPGCPCKCLLSTEYSLMSQSKAKNSVTTQTLFTGDIKGKLVYHETQETSKIILE